MNIEQFNRAIEIKEELITLEKEIDLLPITTHKRRLFKLGKGILEKSYNELYVIKTYTYNEEVIELSKEDIEAIIKLRQDKVEILKLELENL